MPQIPGVGTGARPAGRGLGGLDTQRLMQIGGIAAAVLFYIGTGPVRGFAVTLGIGILTTVFTAFTLTRLIVAGWVRWKRPQSVPI